jgi:hypothetical protein
MDGWSRASERGRRGRTYVRSYVRTYSGTDSWLLLGCLLTVLPMAPAKGPPTATLVGWLATNQPTPTDRILTASAPAGRWSRRSRYYLLSGLSR